MKNRVCFQGQK